MHTQAKQKKHKPTGATMSSATTTTVAITQIMAPSKIPLPGTELIKTAILPSEWHALLAAETSKPYWTDLQTFVATDRQSFAVYPLTAETFSAFGTAVAPLLDSQEPFFCTLNPINLPSALTPPQKVRVVLLGQDPYHGAGQANGLCFSVHRSIKIPPSLRNMFKELHSDLGVAPSSSGDLTSWAQQGFLNLSNILCNVFTQLSKVCCCLMPHLPCVTARLAPIKVHVLNPDPYHFCNLATNS